MAFELQLRLNSRMQQAHQIGEGRCPEAGAISWVTAAPPTTGRRSRTQGFRPCLARYAAQTRPLCPPPMMSASTFSGMSVSQLDPCRRVVAGLFPTTYGTIDIGGD